MKKYYRKRRRKYPNIPKVMTFDSLGCLSLQLHAVPGERLEMQAQLIGKLKR